ncbi:MAG: DUF5606 domain-containing protein [Muribaculaceae bacterium]|nr:DUF5606 domain-containing protein [Muribaculaceae bacterium]
MLKEILSISGRPGLYKLISYGKNMVIVESVVDGKRMPAGARDKIISLGDIAIYTDDEETPLANVFKTMYDKYEGKTIDAKSYKTNDQLFDFFEEILPSFDRDRVYPTDVKKVISWYNTLVNAGLTDFSLPGNKEEDSETKTAEE